MHLRSPSNAPVGSRLESGGSRLMGRVETTDETYLRPVNPFKPVDLNPWKTRINGGTIMKAAQDERLDESYNLLF